MTVKKWRPLWSYDVEKTERWLSDMAAEGQQLTHMNRQSRMFSFEQMECEEVEYRIMYDKLQGDLPRALGESGWSNELIEGKWKFVKNGADAIHVYPSRESILKRNRLHTYLISALAIMNAVPLLTMTITLLPILLGFPGKIVASPLWILTGVFAAQGVSAIVLAIYMNRKVKSFERDHFETEPTIEIEAKKTFSKLKIGWMYAPDLIGNWLFDMAAQGNHLVRVTGSGMRFHFAKGEAEKTSYVYDFQPKVAPSYYSIHKGAGWQLKFTSSSPFMKYSLWAKSYGAGEEIPRLTYDTTEQKAQIRKVLSMNILYIVYAAVLLSFGLLTNFTSFENYERSVFHKAAVGFLMVTAIIPIYVAIRTALYYRRMRSN